MIRLLACTLMAALLVSCGGGGGGSDGAPPIDPGTSLTSSISSAETGIAYALDIWLPPGYAQATTRYPVVYAMDCEYRFTTLVAGVQEAAAAGHAVILVNVCAGSSARRWVDFTMPGAAAYFRFLTLELIPSIDAAYRTVPTNRILSGHSLSGEFAMYALYLENPASRYFTSIVSEECSCWYDAAMVFSSSLAQPAAMEQAMYDASHRLPVNLVMAGDTLSNETQIGAVYGVIAGRHYQDLRITQPVYSLGHVPMDGPAFSDALRFIFGGG
jgi:hypothetical protein